MSGSSKVFIVFAIVFKERDESLFLRLHRFEDKETAIGSYGNIANFLRQFVFELSPILCRTLSSKWML